MKASTRCPSSLPRRETQDANQQGRKIAPLAFEFKPGDWLVMPHKHKAAIALGDVATLKAGTAGWFDSIGMKPGRTHAIIASATEVATGLMLAVGFLTPLAAAGFIGLMTVAIWTVHRKNGFFITKEGWEYTFLIAVAALLFATLPSKYSLDHAFDLDDDFAGTFGFWVSLVLGLGASHLLLAIFYRPPKGN